MAKRPPTRLPLVLAVCLPALSALLASEVRAQAVIDEARQAGRSAQSFPAADEDYFHAMDGGIALTPDEVKGRNMWVVWTGGNDRLWDKLTNLTYGTFDLLKVLSSYPGLKYSRENRFDYFGLVNEPCFTKATGPDPQRHGLWLDQRDPSCPADPFANEQKYPGVAIGARGKNLPVGSYYGYPTGILGLRLFPNPAFNEDAAKRWDPKRFYDDPDYYLSKDLVRPYRVGIVTSGRTRKSRRQTPKRPSGRTSARPSGRSISGSTAFWRGMRINRIFCSRYCTRRGRALWTLRWSRPTTSTTRAR
jgi:hypothetical protein